jgi:glycosyltransferase 2 family protein
MRRNLPRLILLLIILSIVGYLLYRTGGAIQRRGFSWERLKESLGQAKLWLLVVAIGGTYLSYAVRAWRWKRFSCYLPAHNFGNILRATIVGFTAVLLLGRAGEPVRPLLIARKDRVPVASTFGIYVLERLFDAACPLVLAGLSLLVLPNLLAQRGASSAVLAATRTTGIVLLIGLFSAIAFLVYFRLHGAAALERRLEVWREGSGWRRKLGGLVGGLSDGLQAIRTRGDLAAAIGSSMLHWIVVTGVYVCVAYSFGGRLAEIHFPEATIVLVFSMVGSTAQVPMVGGGSQAAAFIALTQIFGVEQEPAAAASVVIWLVTFAAASLGGVPLLIHEGWSMGELKNLAKAEREAEAAGAHLPAEAVPEHIRKLGGPGATK